MTASKTLTFLIFCFLLCSFFSVFHLVDHGVAALIYIGPGQTYQTIQAGIDAANPGDTINIYGGIYDENILVTKSLTITCVEGESVTINDNATESHKHVVKITVDNVIISGLTIQNAKESGMSCIYLVNANNCTISNCIIQGSNNGNGIFLYDSNYNTFQNSIIRNNNAYGFEILFSNHNTIRNNTIQGNSLGIDLSSSTYNTIFGNNSIQGNNQFGIRLQDDADNNNIHHNIIRTNTYGIYCVGNSNTIYFNNFDNGQNANDFYVNTWYSQSLKEGNYWSDYTGSDADGDGIGDTPYNISGGNNQDLYPIYSANKKPTARILSIDPTTASYGTTISFHGNGIDDDGAVVGYRWVSNKDGQLYLGSQSFFSTSTLSAGNQEISFFVQDNTGEWSYPVTATITINAPQNQKPVANIISINPSEALFGTAIYFNGHGTDDGPIRAYKWTSSIDGVIGNEQYFSKSDLSLGTHVITFQVMDNQREWSDPVTGTVIITSSPNNKPPVADAGGPYTGLFNTSITFDGSQSNDTDGHLISYSWDFGDGKTGIGASVQYTFSTPGNYTITLAVTDNQGAKVTDTDIAIITATAGSSSDHTNQNNNNENGNPLARLLDIPLPLLAAILGVIIFIAVLALFIHMMKRT